MKKILVILFLGTTLTSNAQIDKILGVDDAIKRIDEIIQLIRDESDEWRNLLQSLPSEIAGQFNSTIENELTVLANGAISSAGATAACQADVLSARFQSDLHNIKVKLWIFELRTSKKCKGNKIEKKKCQEALASYEKQLRKRLMQVCLPNPIAVKYGEIPSSGLISFYGAGLESNRLGLIVERCNNSKYDISDKLNFQSRYLVSVEISKAYNAYWPTDKDKKIVLYDRNDNSKISEVPVTEVIRYSLANSKYYGENRGQSFRHVPPNYEHIKKIEFNTYNYVDDIRVFWHGPGDLRSKWAGAHKTNKYDVSVPKDSDIIKVTGRTVFDGVTTLKFHLSNGDVYDLSPYHANYAGSKPFTYKVPKNERLIGFEGKVHTWLRRIRFITIKQEGGCPLN